MNSWSSKKPSLVTARACVLIFQVFQFFSSSVQFCDRSRLPCPCRTESHKRNICEPVYKAFFFNGLPAKTAAVKSWLLSPVGDQKLQDTYDPDFFRMSKVGYPYDNAPMERYFNTLKNELIYVQNSAIW